MSQLVTLTRSFKTNGVTMGMLTVEGQDHDPIFTLENPWQDNRPYISCIPEDSYACKPYNGTKYKDVYLVEGVPNRTGILFHSGNVETDTNGCILLGLSAGKLKDEPAVLKSRDAMTLLRLLLGKESFILIIK